MNKKTIFLSGIVLLLTAFSIWRISSLNQQFFMWREETVYEAGETAVYHDFEMTVSDFEVLTQKELEEKYYEKFNVTKEDFQTVSYEQKFLIFRLTAKNISQEKKRLEWFETQSGSFSNLADPSYFNVSSDRIISELNSEFLPGQEHSGLVVASYPKIMAASEQEWKDVDQKKYELVLTLYPKKISMKLN